MMGRTHRGFTLIEVMIVVAIVGILAAIAYPSYRDQVRRSNRTDAYNALLAIANAQEKFYMDNNSYTADMAQLAGFNADPDTSENGHYSVDALAATGPCPLASCFVLEATAQGGQANDAGCTTIRLTSANARTPADCW